ncbi:MAG: hypothetical protein A3C70_02030 [Candidatus Zambryskibacteria bacterium RIFCSPHIGHO2_02_FULL_43_14]|uniref:DUF306 domain-containing protein n=1 Tax=Candidatus Zambryskibacteria bacterium RIFCSPHIGHO2_02_FULL_43_14 TaxID=1802748 RepID=A0A1G2TH85_9BACT|nr:MAG: hypothetical protein A2829_01635 [Candidatus Zambryskibacteria bacterium RIFCSPHIGHO2_01_FULL_43_60]OHA96660.1 MAG: hypothetical protein A3C70_02030 [Candidatus Zambryskibacteria bacterium RIFCSPHIGHO2_02_FULL_43_14]OHB03997.1 MAG: hypothetical protein A3B03_00875 [Candidatus Zambryskibacteria bacterium RIFCSPLOWO2_01_FULL_42_41]
MKTNHVYIITAIVVVILGLIFLNRDETRENDDQLISISTSTPTNTQNINKSGDVGSAQKSVSSQSNTKISKPVETSTPTPTPTPAPEPVPSIPSASNLNGSIFRMTSYNGNAIPLDSRYILSFEEGALSAKFCNSMSGNFVLDGNLLKVSNLASTMMYCATPSNLMEIESAFVSMLNFGAIIYQSGNQIILSYSKGTVMVFTGF